MTKSPWPALVVLSALIALPLIALTNNVVWLALPLSVAAWRLTILISRDPA